MQLTLTFVVVLQSFVTSSATQASRRFARS